jgi:hypothetical protein
MRFRSHFGVLFTFWIGLASPAAAINIVPVFNAADNETPAFDPANNGIQDLFDYAETYYQDIFEDAGYTLTVNYWYDDLEDNTLGQFNPVTEVGHRVTEANVRIDTRQDIGGSLRNWYIDSTPASDSEFEMEKDLWLDGPPNTSGFVAAVQPPGAFEVGYRGTAPFGSPAHNQFDMLSTILHELGHALGIRAGATHENADDDYDINPDFLFDAAVAARVDGPIFDLDPSHVAPDTMLMCGECALTSFRRRPSHADLFAIATSSELTAIDVPRREYYGGGVFNTAANWSGGRTPDPNDEAFVRDADLVVMNASDTVAGLTISYAELATGSNNLTVNGTLRVDSRFFNVLGKLVVATGGIVSADHVVIDSYGEIDMASGTLAVDGDLELTKIIGNGGGFLSGAGTITITGQLANEGTIKPDAGTLSITAGSFDLGGINNFFEPHVDVTTGNVVFNGPHANTFKGIVDVGFGRLATFNNAWTLDPLGEVNITDGGLINNATWQADGNVEINHTIPFGVVGVGGSGAMNLGPSGQITTTGAVDFLGPATIGGLLHVTTEFVRFSGGGTFADSADVVLSGGTAIHLTQAKTYTIESSANFAGAGVLTNGALATLVLESGVDLGAPLVNNGRVEIGTSPGEAHSTSYFQQSASGTIEFEIGGRTQGRLYDHLDVALNEVTLDGTLQLAVINGFMPLPGDTFQIISASNVAGEFQTILGATLPNGSYFDVVYDTTSVLLEVISGLPGDYNNNGTVDAADYTLWRDNLDDLTAILPNDSTPGVDQSDYTIWKTNFGNTLAGAGSGSIMSVPEPATGILFTLGLSALLLRRFAVARLLALKLPHAPVRHYHPLRSFFPVAANPGRFPANTLLDTPHHLSCVLESPWPC